MGYPGFPILVDQRVNQLGSPGRGEHLLKNNFGCPDVDARRRGTGKIKHPVSSTSTVIIRRKQYFDRLTVCRFNGSNGNLWPFGPTRSTVLTDLGLNGMLLCPKISLQPKFRYYLLILTQHHNPIYPHPPLPHLLFL